MRASQEVRDLKRRGSSLPPRGGLFAAALAVSALILLTLFSHAAPVTQGPSLGLPHPPSSPLPSRSGVLPPGMRPGGRASGAGLNRVMVGMQPPALDLRRNLPPALLPEVVAQAGPFSVPLQFFNMTTFP